MSKKPAERSVEYPSPERSQHNDISITRMGGMTRQRVVDQREIDKMLMRGEVTLPEYNELDRLLQIVEMARMYGVSAHNIESYSSGNLRSGAAWEVAVGCVSRVMKKLKATTTQPVVDAMLALLVDDQRVPARLLKDLKQAINNMRG